MTAYRDGPLRPTHQSTSLSAFVGSDRVIRSKLQYESSEAAIRAEIEGALGQ